MTKCEPRKPRILIATTAQLSRVTGGGGDADARKIVWTTIKPSSVTAADDWGDFKQS